MNTFNRLTIIIFAILLLSFNSAPAQLKDRFIKGSIVLQNGEILNGFIRDDEIKVMNYSIHYKVTETEKKVTIYE